MASPSGLNTNSQAEDFLGDLCDHFQFDQIPFSSDDFNEELTYDVTEPFEEQGLCKTKPNDSPILAKEEFEGDYKFNLIVNPSNNDSRHLAFSQNLNKVFIQMGEVLPIRFQWTPPIDGLWVRATMVYKLDQHRSQPVTRCLNHKTPDNVSNRDIDPCKLKHVMRCVIPASIYQELPNGHLSVVTPLGTPVPGVANVPVDYKFYCQNSCTPGMSRRSTEIIFTLETMKNQVIARKKIEVRICSCPVRDKAKEEKELCTQKSGTPVSSSKTPLGKKRKNSCSTTAVLAGKKIKDDDDTQIYQLNLEIIGKDNYNTMVKLAHDVMAGAAVRTGKLKLYQPYLEKILQNSLDG